MKVEVIRRDGTTEIITLTEPLTIVRGDGLNRLCTSTGMEHWFTLDGKYDGWGMACSPGTTMEQATDLMTRTEADREIP